MKTGHAASCRPLALAIQTDAQTAATQVASNLHLYLVCISAKRCYRVHIKVEVSQSETTKTGSTVQMSMRRNSYVSQPTKPLRRGPVPPGPRVPWRFCG